MIVIGLLRGSYHRPAAKQTADIKRNEKLLTLYLADKMSREDSGGWEGCYTLILWALGHLGISAGCSGSADIGDSI